MDRLITVAFKFVPLGAGVTKPGPAFLTGVLGLGTVVGTTIGLVRKVRILCWIAVGTVLLVRRGLTAARVLEDAQLGQRALRRCRAGDSDLSVAITVPAGACIVARRRDTRRASAAVRPHHRAGDASPYALAVEQLDARSVREYGRAARDASERLVRDRCSATRGGEPITLLRS